MSLNSARVRTPRHLQGPSYSDLVDSTQVPFTQFERLDGLNFAVLALDRIVRPEAFPASEKDALAAIERGNRVRSGSYQDRQWMIVVELDNASILVHPYKVKGEDKRTGIVSAKVGQVLLVGPDRSRISTLPASAFTLANR
ncbi:MAG: hypothetical protein EON93_02240 [Burkholderiales bacterium]|nr:MAG: hypothetical protein EON93_02240 [Burkholderiales bacterium]